MMFGDQTNETDSIAMIDYAVDQGVNFLDTAASYSKGAGENVLGKGLKGKRHKVILASKVRNPVTDTMNDNGLNRRHIIDCTNSSLKRLNTDYIDLAYLHAPDYDTDLEETLDTFTTLIRAGKILYLGVSNYASWQVADIMALCDKRGYIKPIISQNVYHLLHRDVERELLPCLKAHKLGMAVYNPIAAGLLSGKYKVKEIQENTRFANRKIYYDRYWTDSYFDGMKKLSAIAEKHGLPLLDVALRWVAYRPGITTVLSGVSKMEQLKQNIKIFDAPALDAGLEKECSKVWDDMEGDKFLYNR